MTSSVLPSPLLDGLEMAGDHDRATEGPTYAAIIVAWKLLARSLINLAYSRRSRACARRARKVFVIVDDVQGQHEQQVGLIDLDLLERNNADHRQVTEQRIFVTESVFDAHQPTDHDGLAVSGDDDRLDLSS